ncbi:MAG: PCRF domain-containing protein [bacterium]|nr:PCRF domain-containing protein [bacterium]
MEYVKKQIEEIDKKIEEAQKLLADPTLADLVQEEIKGLRQQKEDLESVGAIEETEIAANSVIVEIRAAAGGNEAGLFASDLYRMYHRYSTGKGWKVEQLSVNEGGIGNIKEVVFRTTGPGVYEKLKHESGAHRVQRVPATESSGRVHTSTATVAVLPEITDREFHLNPSELKIDTYHASGHGGQNVQKVETAVRVTHVPTGITATCQSERSQFQNKERALSILRSRLYEAKKEAEKMGYDLTRKLQIGTGERSEKIRTYNFPQDRITDHRIGKSWHHIEEILDGNLEPIVGKLQSQLLSPTGNQQ